MPAQAASRRTLTTQQQIPCLGLGDGKDGSLGRRPRCTASNHPEMDRLVRSVLLVLCFARFSLSQYATASRDAATHDTRHETSDRQPHSLGEEGQGPGNVPRGAVGAEGSQLDCSTAELPSNLITDLSGGRLLPPAVTEQQTMTTNRVRQRDLRLLLGTVAMTRTF